MLGVKSGALERQLPVAHGVMLLAQAVCQNLANIGEVGRLHVRLPCQLTADAAVVAGWLTMCCVAVQDLLPDHPGMLTALAPLALDDGAASVRESAAIALGAYRFATLLPCDEQRTHSWPRHVRRCDCWEWSRRCGLVA